MSLSLPTEILVEIFSYTDYITLKHSIRPACTFFRDIIDHAASRRLDPLRYALFRDNITINPQISSTSNIPSNAGNLPCDYHPALDLLRVRPRFGQSDVTPPFGIFNIGFNTPNGFVSIFDSPVAFENATSPASRVIEWTLDKPFDQEYKIDNGWDSRKAVTVLQLIQEVDKAFERYVRRGKKTQGSSNSSGTGDEGCWSWGLEGRKLFRDICIVGVEDHCNKGRTKPVMLFCF